MKELISGIHDPVPRQSPKAGEQGKQSLYISTALRDSTVAEPVSWCLNAKRRPLTIAHRAVRNFRKSSISAQSSCSNRWLTGVRQPTFSPQKRTAVGTMSPAPLRNLHSTSAQTCGNSSDPTQDSNGIPGTEHSQPQAPNQVELVAQLSTCMVLFPPRSTFAQGSRAKHWDTM